MGVPVLPYMNVSSDGTAAGARAVKKALKTFQSITLRDDDDFANRHIRELDRNGNPKDEHDM